MNLDTFSSKRKKKKERKKKGERRKGLLREAFVFDTACWLNRADSKRKGEKKKKLFF